MHKKLKWEYYRILCPHIRLCDSTWESYNAVEYKLMSLRAGFQGMLNRTQDKNAWHVTNPEFFFHKTSRHELIHLTPVVWLTLTQLPGLVWPTDQKNKLIIIVLALKCWNVLTAFTFLRVENISDSAPCLLYLHIYFALRERLQKFLIVVYKIIIVDILVGWLIVKAC